MFYFSFTYKIKLNHYLIKDKHWLAYKTRLIMTSHILAQEHNHSKTDLTSLKS